MPNEQNPRVDHFGVAPELFQPMLEQEKLLKESGLEHCLIELVKLRASQLNGCTGSGCGGCGGGAAFRSSRKSGAQPCDLHHQYLEQDRDWLSDASRGSRKSAGGLNSRKHPSTTSPCTAETWIGAKRAGV